MKTFTKMAAQGDFVIIRLQELPTDLVPFEPEGGVYVVAHSETGHNHVMTMDRVKAFQKPNVKPADLYEMFLKVAVPTEITHLRSHDTHEALLVPPGDYIIKRQREYIPEGFRRAAD